MTSCFCPWHRDFDLIRIKLLEDAEGPWKAKCDNLAKVRACVKPCMATTPVQILCGQVLL